MSIDDAIPGDKNVIKKAAEKMLKYKHLTTETHQSNSNTSNKRGDWNRFKITQTMPEQCNGKEQNQGHK